MRPLSLPMSPVSLSDQLQTTPLRAHLNAPRNEAVLVLDLRLQILENVQLEKTRPRGPRGHKKAYATKGRRTQQPGPELQAGRQGRSDGLPEQSAESFDSYFSSQRQITSSVTSLKLRHIHTHTHTRRLESCALVAQHRRNQTSERVR